MSLSKKHQTIFVQLRLGRASDYSPTIFPLVSDSTALKAGEVYLEYTLDEIIKVRDMVKQRPNYRMEYKDMKRRYDQLAATMTNIEGREKTSNPFKAVARYRRNRLFINAIGKFSLQVKRTSEAMRRHTQLSTSQISVVSDGVVAVERGDISTEQKEVSGIAIKCDRDLDDNLRAIIEEAASILTQSDPFDDSAQVANDDSAPTIDSAGTATSSSSGSAGASRSSTSSNITNVTYIENCHISSSSVSGVDIRSPTLKRLSINAGNHHNDGAVTQNAGSASFSESP